MGIKQALILFIFAISLEAATYVVATNPSSKISHLSREDISALYLDKKHLLRGKRAILLNLPLDDKIRISFEKSVLRKSRVELQRYWLRAHFSGHRPPKVVKSQETAANFISKVRNSIGYMEKSLAQKNGLKILYEWRE